MRNIINTMESHEILHHANYTRKVLSSSAGQAFAHGISCTADLKSPILELSFITGHAGP